MLRPGQAVALCVLALLTIGVVMVNSAGMTVRTREPFTIEAILLSKTMLYAALAMAALLACSVLPLRRLVPSVAGADASVLEEPAEPAIDEPLFSPAWFRALIREYVKLWPLWTASLALVVLLASVYVPGIRSPKNGSHRWINMHMPGLESVQPSELAKWGLVIVIAAYAACSIRRMRSFWLGLVPGLIAAGLVAGFVVIEDLGTGALMGMVACLVLIAAGARLWHLLILCPVPLAGAALAIVTNPYRMHRIESFLNPFLDPQGKGFHMIQSMSAISGGGAFGRGLGGGLQKFGYLPEDTTDFIFATICEELGIAGAAIVLFLMGALVWSVWGIVRRENVAALKLLGLGVMGTVGIQAVINLAVVTGLGPTKGIALPLISSGGTGWILTAAALGLVVAMDRQQLLWQRRTTCRTRQPEREPEGYAIPALGAVAMSAAAATANMAEIKNERVGQAVVATQGLVLDDDSSTGEVGETAHAVTAGAAHDELGEEDAADEPPALEMIAAADREHEPAKPEVAAIAKRPVEPDASAIAAEPVSAPIEAHAKAIPEESIEAMFAGAVIAEPPPVRDLPPVVLEESQIAGSDEPTPKEKDVVVEPKPMERYIPGLPGQTGLLFGAEPSDAPSQPQIVVTEKAKNWLNVSNEESTA